MPGTPRSSSPRTTGGSWAVHVYPLRRNITARVAVGAAGMEEHAARFENRARERSLRSPIE